MEKKLKHSETYTDFEVIDKIVSGERELYEILMRRYNPYLYRIGRTYHYNHQDTEDLMQESYINAYSALNKFEKRSTFKTWITKIMLNQCFARKQKFSFKNEIPTETLFQENNKFMFQENNNTDNIILQKELAVIIEKALLKIPEDYRTVFTLRELNGSNVAETAEILNISEANVKTRLSRAKEMLRIGIEKNYSSEEIFEFNLIYCDRIVDSVMEKISKIY